MKSASATDELAPKILELERELGRLHQLLADAKSNLDELRRERDHTGKRAGPMTAAMEPRVWFCGQASAAG
jgi:uncharacterized coiled-coil DUF342 family protein